MPALSSEPSPEPRARVRACVCDDVREFRRLMRFALADDPAIEVVAEAADGDECLDAIAEARPDVVVLDLSMPGRDGLEVIDELRERAPGVRVVVVSGFAASRMEKEVLARGAVRYLEKGTPLAEVRGAVREAAAGR